MGNKMSKFLNGSSALIEKPEDLTPEKKRKHIEAEELTNSKKIRNDTQNAVSLNSIINRGIPHVAELIFESMDTPELLSCMEVSETWKELAENVLIKRWKGKMLKACQNGQTKVVQLLLECCNSEESGLNTRDKYGWTPFMWACLYGHKEVVQLLLDTTEMNIDLNARNQLGQTAFMHACRNGLFVIFFSFIHSLNLFYRRYCL